MFFSSRFDDDGHIVNLFPQLQKTAAEAKRMICSALSKDGISYTTRKKWFQKYKSARKENPY